MRTPLGWKVERPGSSNLTTIRVQGRPFVVKRGKGGWIAKAMHYYISELHRIESLNVYGWDGSYNYRPVTNGTSWSEHASGTAFDHNAAKHPYDGGRYVGFSTEQVREIRKLLNSPIGRLFRWGSDYQRTKDAMHHELRGPATWLRHRKATIKFLKARGY